MGQVITAYTDGKQHERETFKDKNQALQYKKELISQGYKAKMKKWTFDWGETWEVEGEK